MNKRKDGPYGNSLSAPPARFQHHVCLPDNPAKHAASTIRLPCRSMPHSLSCSSKDPPLKTHTHTQTNTHRDTHTHTRRHRHRPRRRHRDTETQRHRDTETRTRAQRTSDVLGGLRAPEINFSMLLLLPGTYDAKHPVNYLCCNVHRKRTEVPP